MRILFIGDIVGSSGREIVRERLADIVAQRRIDLVIANCENAAAGFGITPRLAEDLLSSGVDVLTGGNHIWDRREILDYAPRQPRLLRPANFPEGNPGSGLFLGKTKNGDPYAVLDLQGRVFMPAIDCPFRTADRLLASLPAETGVVVVDFHAEATSEKLALSWYLDGRVTAVVGTHTHVVTADERILPLGSACITDVGMTGPHAGVIGMDRHGMIKRFLDAMPARFDVASGDLQMNAVLIETRDTAVEVADAPPGGNPAYSGPGLREQTVRSRSVERLCFRLD